MKKNALIIGLMGLMSGLNTSTTEFVGGSTTRGKKQLMKPSTKGWRYAKRRSDLASEVELYMCNFQAEPLNL